MSQKTPVTVAYGDGICPEIMEASLHIIQEAGPAPDTEVIEIGERYGVVKMETLRTFDGKPGFSLAQGQ